MSNSLGPKHTSLNKPSIYKILYSGASLGRIRSFKSLTNLKDPGFLYSFFFFGSDLGSVYWLLGLNKMVFEKLFF